MTRMLLCSAALLAALVPVGCSMLCCEEETASVSASGAAIAVADDEDEAGDDADEEESEQVIALDQVPAAVLAAGQAAAPGVVLTGAVVEQEHGQLVYELIGTLDGERIEIEVAADGRVLEIERGEDD